MVSIFKGVSAEVESMGDWLPVASLTAHCP